MKRIEKSLSYDKREHSTVDEPPEGGFKAWLVLCAASTIMAMTFGMCNSYGVYQSYYEKRYYNISSSVLSIIGALQSALTFLFALPSTIGMNYLGPQVMVGIGGILCCLSYMFLSISNSVWQVFVIQGLMFGMGSGIMYVHATGVTFQYFEKKKALAQGIITACASMGGVYWPIGVHNLIEKVGFRWANRIIGFLYLPMFIFSVIFLRPRVEPTKRKPGENMLRVKFGVLLNWKFLVVGLGWSSFMLSLFPGLFYIDLFCTRANVNKSLQTYSVPIVNACACIFRVVPGFLADKFGRINLIIPALLLSGIFPLAIWIPAHDTGTTAAFIVTWGSASAVPVALFPPIVGQLFKGPDMYSFLSFFFIFGGISSFVGPIIGGTFIPKGNVDSTEGFNKLAIYCGILCLFSTTVMVFIRSLYSKSLFDKL